MLVARSRLRSARQQLFYKAFLHVVGVTVRKTIDTLIATRCIGSRLPLLYSDRDFDPFVEHLGLRPAFAAAEGADARAVKN